MDSPWTDLIFIALDTEASGPYPMGGELCEIGAVKWQRGQIVAEFQTLLKTREPMSDFIISIHGISNEMVANAPFLEDKIGEFHDFIKDSVLMAHHAPFDMGFIGAAFEDQNLPLPMSQVVCTSLLARKLIPEAPNHKLQTLIQTLNIPQGIAHRALDDAKACLSVGLECFHRVGESASMASIFSIQKTPLHWSRFSLMSLKKDMVGLAIFESLKNKQNLDIIYEGGSNRGQTRRLKPLGFVRNPDGDYLVGICFIDRTKKRFYLNRIREAAMAPSEP